MCELMTVVTFSDRTNTFFFLIFCDEKSHNFITVCSCCRCSLPSPLPSTPYSNARMIAAVTAGTALVKGSLCRRKIGIVVVKELLSRRCRDSMSNCFCGCEMRFHKHPGSFFKLSIVLLMCVYVLKSFYMRLSIYCLVYPVSVHVVSV